MENAEDIRRFIETKFLDGKKLQNDQQPLFSSGAVDSLGVLELIAFLEKKFGFEIDTNEHELSEFDSVERILALVQTLSHAGSPN